MSSMNWLRTGAVLAATAGIGYIACALVFWAWPAAAAGFMNALFHGLDFGRLQSGPTLFNFNGFLYALVGLMLWAFGLGAVYGWLQSRFTQP